MHFETFIMILIIINAVTLASKHFGQPYEYTIFLEYSNYIFAVIFTLEAILKLIGLGFIDYFSDTWNIFDFLVVIGTDIGIFLTIFKVSNLSAITIISKDIFIYRNI